MPNDHFTLNILTKEIQGEITGAKIIAISHAPLNSILIGLRCFSKKNLYLIISANNTTPLFFLTEKKYSGQKTPDGFIMLLRKHLIGGIIENIVFQNNDRILRIKINVFNELYDQQSFFMIFEIAGLKSNLLILDSEDTILGLFKNLVSIERTLVNNFKYFLPAKNLLNKEQKIDFPLEPFMGKLTKLEYLHIAKLENQDKANIFFKKLISFENKYQPSVFLRNAKVFDFFVYPYRVMQCDENNAWQYCSNLSSCVELYYQGMIPNGPQEEINSNIEKALLKQINKTKTRIYQLKNILNTNDELLNILTEAELLKGNLHKIVKGSPYVECQDYNNNEMVVIPLEASLSAAKNLAKKYKQYAKIKGALNYANSELPKLNLCMEHLESVLFLLNISETASDHNLIIKELEQTYGNIFFTSKSNTHKSKLIPPTNYIQIKLYNYIMLIGKNNLQNDEITFKKAKSNDIWLHAHAIPGSHGLIITNNVEVPEKILLEAASFVAFYSSGREETKVNIDYTSVKNVKRGTKPGLVRYSKYSTVTVKPIKPAF